MSRSMVTSCSFFSSSRIFAACPVTRPWPGNTSATGFETACSLQRCSRLRAIPKCVATSVTLLPSSVTRRTASFLNCGLNVRRSRVGAFAMDHLRAVSGSYLGVHFPGQVQAIIDMVVRSYLLICSIDRYLLSLPSPVNRQRHQLFAVVLQRDTLANSLARNLERLGLRRRAREVPSLASYVEAHDVRRSGLGDTES